MLKLGLKEIKIKIDKFHDLKIKKFCSSSNHSVKTKHPMLEMAFAAYILAVKDLYSELK